MKATIHAPLFKTAAAFLAGILLTAKIGMVVYAMLVPVVLLAAASRIRKLHPMKRDQIGSMALLGLFLVLGAAWHDVKTWNPQGGIPSQLVGERVMLRGLVDRAPKITDYGRYTWLRLESAKADSALFSLSGRCVVYLSLQDSSALAEGDTLLVLADLKVATSRNEGYLEYLHSQGIFHAAYAKQTIVLPAQHRGAMAWMAAYRTTLSERLGGLFADSSHAGIAQAMFLGDKQGLSADTKAAFARTGLSHILAVSGLHVGVIFLGLGMLFHLIRRLPQGHRIQQLLILGALLGYMVLAGAGAAVVRAVLMFGMILVVKLLGKKAHLLNVLAFSAWCQMLWDPAVIFEVGFQLSYAAVLGIFWLLPSLEKQWPKQSPLWLKNLYGGLGVTIAATLFTTPFVLYYFGTFPSWFLLSNVPVSFLAFPLILCGFLTVVLSMLCPWQAPVQGMAHICDTLIGWLNTWADICSSLPYAGLSLDTLSLAHVWIIGGQLLVVWILFRLPTWSKKGLFQFTPRSFRLLHSPMP